MKLDFLSKDASARKSRTRGYPRVRIETERVSAGFGARFTVAPGATPG